MVPPAYLSELEKLQDRIPPFSDTDARALIESELGQPISVVFSELTTTTVAAASLGQVQDSHMLQGFPISHQYQYLMTHLPGNLESMGCHVEGSHHQSLGSMTSTV